MRMFRALVAGLILCGTLSFTTDAQTTAAAPTARPVLVIQSTPGGVQVYVDDELLGTTSPEGRLKISTLKPGKHALRVSLGGTSYGEGQFTLLAGKSLTKTIALPEQANAPSQPLTAQPSPTTPAAQTQQSAPTLPDTVNWIGSAVQGVDIKFKGQNQSDTRGWFREEIVQTNFQTDQGGCFIAWDKTDTVTQSYDMKPDGQPVHYVENLSYLSPSATIKSVDNNIGQVQGWRVTGDAVNYVVQVHNSQGSAMPDMFVFADIDTAQRVANALNHAIELCGGKKEPF